MKCDVSWRLEVGAATSRASGGDLISVEIESTGERERREKSLWDVTR